MRFNVRYLVPRSAGLHGKLCTDMNSRAALSRPNNSFDLWLIRGGVSSASLVDAVAFTHVPKAGGTSMQKFLAGRAQQVGKTHFNARTFSMKNKGTTLDALRMEALKADVILGHAPHAWQADRRALGWRGGDFTAVALLRQ